MKNQQGFVSIVLSVLIVILLIGGVVYSLFFTKESPVPVAQKELDASSLIDKSNTVSSKPDVASSEKKQMEQVAKNGDILVMNYTGRLTNGTVFDSNVDPKFGHVQPFEFKLGAGMVIKGWDEGLVGMKVGEKKTLNIPAEKGYGARGAGAHIPPNSDLIFDVELVGIK